MTTKKQETKNQGQNGPLDSDGWLLLSIILAAKNQPAELESIIAIGDGINHAIFTFVEMRNGLKRLTVAGYVQTIGDQYQPTKAALALYENISKKTKSVHKQLELLNSNLTVIPAVRIEESRSFELSRKSFQEAVDSYLKKVRV